MKKLQSVQRLNNRSGDPSAAQRSTPRPDATATWPILNTVRSEIVLLEERFRLAQLGPDPHFFESILADDAALISEEAKPFSKSTFVDAHRPGRYPRYTRVEISDLKIMDSGAGVVVTCKGTYEGPDFSGTLKFMRAWIKRNNRWQIVASAVVK